MALGPNSTSNNTSKWQVQVFFLVRVKIVYYYFFLKPWWCDLFLSRSARPQQQHHHQPGRLGAGRRFVAVASASNDLVCPRTRASRVPVQRISAAHILAHVLVSCRPSNSASLEAGAMSDEGALPTRGPGGCLLRAPRAGDPGGGTATGETATTTTPRPARAYLEQKLRRRRRNVGQFVGTISWHLGRKAGAL